jgi:hypothetical protein
MAKLAGSLVSLALSWTLSTPVLAQSAPPVASPPVASPPVAPRRRARYLTLPPLYWSPASVSFTSEPEGLAFYRVTSLIVLPGRRGRRIGRVYQPLCTAPCSLGLAPGLQEFALGLPGEVPEFTELVTIPPGSSELSGYVESRAATRAWGWAVLIGSIVGGSVLLVKGLGAHETHCDYNACYETSGTNTGLVIGGSTVLALGTIIGAVLAATRDVTHIELRGIPRLVREPSMN